MSPPAAAVWLVAGYALVLVAIAWSFDAMAMRASNRAAQWRTGRFTYRPDHDAWVCPEDHWLWPTSYDPQNRVMRYRAQSAVCNSCPVKKSCTASDHGREISREVDPWPHSDAGRFHRGIACFVASLGVVLPLGMLISNHQTADALVLLGTVLVVVVVGLLPLTRHLWKTPANAPTEHLPHRTGMEEQVAAAINQYSTRWGGGWADHKDKTDQADNQQPGRQPRGAVNSVVIIVVVAAVLTLAMLALVSLNVLREYERGVVFRMGHIRPLYQPGLKFLFPLADKMIRVDQRVVTLTIPPQELITRDNVPARVNAVVMFQVVDPLKAILAVENYAVATSQISQTTLRSLLGRADLDTLLAHREDLNADLRVIIEKQTEPWGIEVRVVEIKDVEIPESMQRAMAREAEAERERRAKVISARGELQASAELRQAAEELSKSPASLQLRYLQTLLELGADQNSTVVFPLPVDIITPFLKQPGLLKTVADTVVDTIATGRDA